MYRMVIYKRSGELVIKTSMKNLDYVRRVARNERARGGQVFVNVRGGSAHGKSVSV